MRTELKIIINKNRLGDRIVMWLIRLLGTEVDYMNESDGSKSEKIRWSEKKLDQQTEKSVRTVINKVKKGDHSSFTTYEKFLKDNELSTKP